MGGKWRQKKYSESQNFEVQQANLRTKFFEEHPFPPGYHPSSITLLVLWQSYSSQFAPGRWETFCRRMHHIWWDWNPKPSDNEVLAWTVQHCSLTMLTIRVVATIGGLAVVAFWRSPHGPLGSGPPRAGYSQWRKRKEKGKRRKKEGERKEKEKKRREEREEDLRPIWAGYSVFRLCTSLYTRPLI